MARKALLREDEDGLFVVANGARYRPGAINGYSHAHDMSSGSLRSGTYLRVAHMPQTPTCRITLEDGRKLLWASEYMHAQERRFRNSIPEHDSNSVQTEIPHYLANLSEEIEGLDPDEARRLIVSKVGSVGDDETFDDDVVDAVFTRLQRTSQIGQYADEQTILSLGRGARRLEGEGTITLYRAAPPGAGIRPGDFATDCPDYAGYYAHGGNVLHSVDLPRKDVFAVEGSLGGGQEFIHLPMGYVPPVPEEPFKDFRSFYEAVCGEEMAYEHSQAPFIC